MRKDIKHAYKNQGVTQVFGILGNQVLIVFVGDSPVDGPKLGSWVGLGLWLGLHQFQTRHRLLKPKAERGWFGPSRTDRKLEEIPTQLAASPRTLKAPPVRW